MLIKSIDAPESRKYCILFPFTFIFQINGLKELISLSNFIILLTYSLLQSLKGHCALKCDLKLHAKHFICFRFSKLLSLYLSNSFSFLIVSLSFLFDASVVNVFLKEGPFISLFCRNASVLLIIS